MLGRFYELFKSLAFRKRLWLMIIWLFSFLLKASLVYVLIVGINFGLELVIAWLFLIFIIDAAIVVLLWWRLHEREAYFTRLMDVERNKQDFISLASHNLRTPVAAINGYVELLQSDNELMQSEHRLYVERIQGCMVELTRVIEQLLQISIIETDENKNGVLLLQNCQPLVLLEEVVDQMRSLAKDKGLELLLKEPKGPLPMVYVDVEKIRAVTVSLVDNAIKYTEQGSVVVEGFVKAGMLCVEVRDTGMGIPKSEIPKLFQKFYRTGNVLVYNQTGAGLGLYLSNQIIELHGGVFEVESEEGKGSCFRFMLPVSRDI